MADLSKDHKISILRKKMQVTGCHTVGEYAEMLDITVDDVCGPIGATVEEVNYWTENGKVDIEQVGDDLVVSADVDPVKKCEYVIRLRRKMCLFSLHDAKAYCDMVSYDGDIYAFPEFVTNGLTRDEIDNIWKFALPDISTQEFCEVAVAVGPDLGDDNSAAGAGAGAGAGAAAPPEVPRISFKSDVTIVPKVDKKRKSRLKRLFSSKKD